MYLCLRVEKRIDDRGNKVNVVGDFENLEDLKYDLKLNGQLDLGKIYQVFSQKGLDVKGFIKANLVLKGQQSDATKGHYNR